MAGTAIKLVNAYLESKEINATQVREDLLRMGWNIKGGEIQIFLQFDESDSYVHLEGMDFIKVPEDKYDIMYKVVNQCNDDYKYVKFVLDTENGEIRAREDIIIQLDSCGEECYELMVRMLQIVEDAYPKFMRAIWA